MIEDLTSPALLERERELAELERLVEHACAGRGSMVLLEGPPGIGKTRLLESLRAHASEREMAVITGRASELDRDFPFGVVRQLFGPLLASAGDERRAALLDGAAAPAAFLVGLTPPEDNRAATDSDSESANFHALYWLVANLAEDRPALLAIDDIHWADASSSRFIQFLLPRLEELPILVAAAARPSEPSVEGKALDAIATDPVTLVLRPAPLGEGAIKALVTAAFANDPEPEFCEACREATGGNPFLLRELLRELAAERVTPAGGDISFVRQLAPRTVARSVLLRVARLGDEAAALARAVAVFGDRVPLRRAATLACLSEAQAEKAATSLAQANILERVRPLAFAHPILRAAVYSDLDPGERSRLHRDAAAALTGEGANADGVAVHLLPTEPSGDPAVVETLREAAASAIARGSSSTAVALLERALSEPPPRDARGSVVLELAAAELRAGNAVAASEHFAEGLRISSDPRTRAAYAGQQRTALLALGRPDDALALLEREVEEAADVDRELALLLEADLIATAAFDRSRLDWVSGRLERYRGKLTGATQGERMLLATQAHIDAVFTERAASELADAAERALASGQLFDHLSGTSPTFFQAIDVLLIADRIDAARWELDRALDHARRRGSAPVFAFASGWRCWLMAREGNLPEAEADGRSCAEVSLPQGWFTVVPLILGHLLDVLVDRGELDDADRLLQESGMYERPADDYRAFDRAAYARMRLLIARGNLETARTDFHALALRTRRERWTTYPAYVPAALVAPVLVADDPDAARLEAERTLRDAKTWGTPRAIGMAIHATALVEERDAKRLELLEEASCVLESSPARLEHARALADFGAALRRANHRASARGPLRRALDIADACGARPLAAHARHELRAAGARPRRPRSTGADALTASERRIALMAADGLSNPEIAQALFVTKKTVETHLSNAYRKLDISSRNQLSAALRFAKT